jgi:hypothetical protein
MFMGERSLEHVSGWENQRGRLVLLSAGWLLLVGGIGSLIVGWLYAQPLPLSVGLVASLAAWAVSGLLPDPRPAARRDVREREKKIARLAGHQLPA